MDIEIISGEEEGKLIFGTFFLLDIDRSIPFIVIDVGGGSTEISVFEKGKRIASKSFELGTLRLLKEKVDPVVWNDISTWILENVDMKIPHDIYGTGGNINKMHKLLGAYNMEPVTLSEIENFTTELKALTFAQRVEKFQLKPDRADVIVPAGEIFIHIMKALGQQKLFVPKIGLSDGIIYDLHLNSRKRKTSN